MIRFTIHHVLVTLVIALAVIIAGLWSWQRVPVDAIPDLSDNQVVVWAEWPGKSAEDVQVQITQRLTAGLQGMAGVQTVRGLSLYGVSYAYVIFREGRNFYDCRTRVLERLANLQAEMPPGVVAQLGPDATAMGQVFAFTVQGPRDLETRRRVIDQIVVPALSAVSGVAEVAPAGGVVREYQIDVDATRLEEQAITLDELVSAVKNAGRDVGAMSIERSGVETMIRGIGFVRSIADVEGIVVKGNQRQGAGVQLKQVANVSLGGAVRQGILADQHGEQAGAIVAMRVGEDPRAVISALKQRLLELQPALQRDDLVAVPFYDRSQLIAETRETLTSTLIEELITTLIVVLAFLLHTRAALAIGLTLPLGMLATFIVMHGLGMSANLMSLAGIAIAIGVMVDFGLVVCENIFQHMLALQDRLAHEGQTMPRSPADPRIIAAVEAGAREVAPAIMTAALTTIIGFLPIFFLDGQAGRLFAPLAMTKTLAIAGAAVFGLLLVPMLCRLLLPPWALPRWLRIVSVGLAAGAAFGWYMHGITIALDHGRWALVVPGWLAAPVMSAIVGSVVWRFAAERLRPLEENSVSHGVAKIYERFLGWVLEHKWAFIARCLLIAALGYLLGLGWTSVSRPIHAVASWCGADLSQTRADRWLAHTFPGLPESFLPPLDEGSLLFMPSILSQGGLGESLRVLNIQNKAIAEVPEVQAVMGKMGRAETALDPAPIGMVETVVVLKPYRDWPVQDIILPGGGSTRRPRTLDEVRAALAAASDIPGVAPSWLQPIETRVVMLSTGIKSLIALQVAGDDSEAIERFTEAAEKIIQGTPGAVDVQANREGGKPYAEVRLDRERLARFNLNPEQVLMAVETAIGGMPLTTSVEGNQRYGIRLRYMRERRDDPDELALMQVPVMSGGHGAIPLSSLVAPPIIYTLRFAGTTPEAWRATHSLSLARHLTVLSSDTAELVLPAGEPLPPGVTEVSHRDHPDALTYTMGPMQIRSENGKRVGYVLLNVRGTGEVEVVTEANRRVQQAMTDGRLVLPPGTSVKWVGRYEQKQRADAILRVVIAVALGVMVLLIYLGTRNWVTTAIILIGNLPVVVAGGLIGVWMAGAQMTTAVMVGFIALLGTMFNDGILIGLYLDERFKVAPKTIGEVRQLTIAAGLRRIRPALMTNCTTLLSLIPILWSDGRGSEIMLPMALPIIGGMAIDMLSPFTVPCLYAWWWERKLLRAATVADRP